MPGPYAMGGYVMGDYAMGGYAPTPAIWLPLVGAALAVVLGLYCWRRRDTSAVRPLLYAIVLTFFTALATALAAAAVDPVTRTAWYKVRATTILPAATAEVCFVLEYTYPGRWLTRRNLALLALPPLLVALMIFTTRSDAIWRAVAPDLPGMTMQVPGPAGFAFLLYLSVLGLAGAVALLWLFVRSPQHRQPVGLMLASQVVSSILLLLYVVRQPSALRFDVAIITVLMVLIVYVVAVFGFRIFDPLPVARQAVLQQMHAAFIVFDARWRVLGLNPAAEDLLGTAESMARGKTWGQVTPPGELLLPDLSASGAGDLPDITLGRGADTRYYAPALSALADFRGLLMGYLLMLRDVTEERRGYAQALERQRAQAIQSERERMARELHDSLGQVLSYTSMQVETAAQLALDGQGEAAAARLSRLGTVVRDAHADLRESILNLQSAARYEDPFCSVAQHYLDGFTRNYDIRAQLHVEGNFGEEALRPETKLHLLRILQEALSNARKHGQAHQVQVTLARANGCLRMTVEDDGIGFDPQQVARDGGAHFGLQFMADRAEELGGSLQVTSAPGGGTRVVLEIPADGPRLTGDGGRP